MKLKVLGVIAVMLASIFSLSAQVKTEKFKVFGNCSMCEKRIETAALAVEGVSAADWNKDTKMIEVKFDESKTNIHKVHMAIAKAGHDTEMHKATDEAYNKLPGCCQYDRSDKKMKMDHDHMKMDKDHMHKH